MSEIATLVSRTIGTQREMLTPVPGLKLYRETGPGPRKVTTYEAGLGIVVQGRKSIAVGKHRHVFEGKHYILTPATLPVETQILSASPTMPFLGLLIKLDIGTVRDLISSSPPVGDGRLDKNAIACPLTRSLDDAVRRLICLIDTPQHIPILANLIHREIVYHLLCGPHGIRLHEAAARGMSAASMRALAWLDRNFHRKFSMSALANRVQVAESTLHHGFRRLTGMSPLQYQKELRLREARRLLFADDAVDQGTAALRVGYQSVSQFNREYRRLFGRSPGFDRNSLKPDLSDLQ
jgi:AraC-like DNA-binding protein